MILLHLLHTLSISQAHSLHIFSISLITIYWSFRSFSLCSFAVWYNDIKWSHCSAKNLHNVNWRQLFRCVCVCVYARNKILLTYKHLTINRLKLSAQAYKHKSLTTLLPYRFINTIKHSFTHAATTCECMSELGFVIQIMNKLELTGSQTYTDIQWSQVRVHKLLLVRNVLELSLFLCLHHIHL